MQLRHYPIHMERAHWSLFPSQKYNQKKLSILNISQGRTFHAGIKFQ